MSREGTMHLAEERLLDAALAQVFARRRAATAPARPWLAAALVLLGVAVTAATMWLARGAERDAAQEPAPLPPQVPAEGKAAIEALPTDTENLAAVILHPDHAKVLSRFPKLRRLVLSPLDVRIASVNTRKKLAVWEQPPPDLLAEVAQLPALESLQIGARIAVTPAVLEPLRRCAGLRALELSGEHVVFDEAFVAALAAIPSLRALQLHSVRADAAAIAKLRTTPITALHTFSTAGFDAEAWTALCAWKELEALSFGGLGRQHTFVAGMPTETSWRPGPDELRRLAELPKLRSLTFRGCDLRDDDLLALPTGITELELAIHELTPAGLQHLRRFGALRSLSIGTARFRTGFFDQTPASERAAAADAVAEALGTLRLQRLSYYGAVLGPLPQAIAAQPDLAWLSLTTGSFGQQDLAEIAKAPALHFLRLSTDAIGNTLPVETFAPLRQSRSLRTFQLYVNEERGAPGLDEAALQKQLGDGVTLRVQRTLFTVKR